MSKGNAPMEQDQSDIHFSEHDLVFMMGEELKKPLTVIKALADTKSDDETISIEARRALRTIDNILLYQRIAKDQMSLALEPVHLGSALIDVVESLRPLSMAFGCETEVFIQSGTMPVDADRSVLTAGIESLWQAVLGLTKSPSAVSWQLQRKSNGARLIVTNATLDISKIALNRHTQAGKSRQPFSGHAGPATDLLTAQALFHTLGARLSKYHTDSASGFTVTLKNNPQLALV